MYVQSNTPFPNVLQRSQRGIHDALDTPQSGIQAIGAIVFFWLNVNWRQICKNLVNVFYSFLIYSIKEFLISLEVARCRVLKIINH